MPEAWAPTTIAEDSRERRLWNNNPGLSWLRARHAASAQLRDGVTGPLFGPLAYSPQAATIRVIVLRKELAQRPVHED